MNVEAEVLRLRQEVATLKRQVAELRSGIIPSDTVQVGTGGRNAVRIFFHVSGAATLEGTFGEPTSPWLGIDPATSDVGALLFFNPVAATDPAPVGGAGTALKSSDVLLYDASTGAAPGSTATLSAYLFVDSNGTPIPIELKSEGLDICLRNLPLYPSGTYGSIDSGKDYTIAEDGFTLTLAAAWYPAGVTGHPVVIQATRKNAS